MIDPAAPVLPPALRDAGIALRSQRPGDLALGRALYAASRAAELAFVPWPAAVKQQFIDSQFALQTAHFAAIDTAELLIVTRTVAPMAPVAIGRLYIDRRTDPWNLLEIGLVAPEQGRGTGGALVAWLMDEAARAGAIGVRLHVVPENRGAIALYTRLGFRPTAGGGPSRNRMDWCAPRAEPRTMSSAVAEFKSASQ